MHIKDVSLVLALGRELLAAVLAGVEHQLWRLRSRLLLHTFRERIRRDLARQPLQQFLYQTKINQNTVPVPVHTGDTRLAPYAVPVIILLQTPVTVNILFF
jgi:hypothetical protein